MTTTVRLDVDLARQFEKLARQRGQPFDQVVNEAIRRSLTTGEKPLPRPPRFVVEAKDCGFRRWVDPSKLNQLN